MCVEFLRNSAMKDWRCRRRIGDVEERLVMKFGDEKMVMKKMVMKKW